MESRSNESKYILRIFHKTVPCLAMCFGTISYNITMVDVLKTISGLESKLVKTNLPYPRMTATAKTFNMQHLPIYLFFATFLTIYSELFFLCSRILHIYLKNIPCYFKEFLFFVITCQLSFQCGCHFIYECKWLGNQNSRVRSEHPLKP